MTDAFVHVHVDQGVAREAASEIGALDNVANAHLVTGDYDIVVQLDLGDTDEIPDVVAREIHGVTGVLDTVTNVAFDP
jgi:DNA-binding Lrp family transcriptional regulator